MKIIALAFALSLSACNRPASNDRSAVGSEAHPIAVGSLAPPVDENQACHVAGKRNPGWQCDESLPRAGNLDVCRCWAGVTPQICMGGGLQPVGCGVGFLDPQPPAQPKADVNTAPAVP